MRGLALMLGTGQGFGEHRRSPTHPKTSKAIADIHSRIDISMCSMPTVRTGKHMASPYTTQATTGTILTCVPRVNRGNEQAVFLCFVLNAGAHHPTLPQRQTTSICLAL